MIRFEDCDYNHALFIIDIILEQIFSNKLGNFLCVAKEKFLNRFRDQNLERKI